MNLPVRYIEQVYAGILGKIIGVYLGRPFEGWTYEKIMAELGEINYYVHEKRAVPLIVIDDDIAGTLARKKFFLLERLISSIGRWGIQAGNRLSKLALRSVQKNLPAV